MKRIFTLSLVFIFSLSLGLQRIKAQSQSSGQDGFENILNSGIEHANTYLKNYMSPAAYSIGNGLANGWYNTAKPHKTLGFDLTVNVNLATIPDAAKTFEFVEADYDGDITLNDPSDNQLPTFIGGGTNQELVLAGSQNINAPNGIFGDQIDYKGPIAIPTPTIQLGIGIVKNTDLIIRYSPEVNVGDFGFQSFGFGVKHDIKQWIPGMKLLPFDLSALIGFNKIKTTYQIDKSNEQYAEFGASSTTVQALISKKLLFFTPYAGLGFNIVKSNFAMKGVYTEGGQTFTDPINLDFDGSGGARFTVGARVKILWVLALNVDYTFQQYNTLSVGLGLNIR